MPGKTRQKTPLDFNERSSPEDAVGKTRAAPPLYNNTPVRVNAQRIFIQYLVRRAYIFLRMLRAFNHLPPGRSRSRGRGPSRSAIAPAVYGSRAIDKNHRGRAAITAPPLQPAAAAAAVVFEIYLCFETNEKINGERRRSKRKRRRRRRRKRKSNSPNSDTTATAKKKPNRNKNKRGLQQVYDRSR